MRPRLFRLHRTRLHRFRYLRKNPVRTRPGLRKLWPLPCRRTACGKLHPGAPLRNGRSRTLRRKIHLFLPLRPDLLCLSHHRRGRQHGQDHRRPLHDGGTAGFHRLRTFRTYAPGTGGEGTGLPPPPFGSPGFSQKGTGIIRPALYGRRFYEQCLRRKQTAGNGAFRPAPGTDQRLHFPAEGTRGSRFLSL